MRAPAKLNLGLRVVGRRAVGYHELQSLFWPIDLLDELWIREGVPASFSTEWADEAPVTSTLPTGGTNLVERAAQLAAVAGHRDILLRKRIPLGAGLGGGSSDAAALLRYLSLRDETLSHRLALTAVELGADVPFFLNATPSWVEGIGERCSPVAFTQREAELHFLVVLLPNPLATPEVFRRHAEGSLAFSARTKAPERESLHDYLRQATNDLEPAAIFLYPLIGRVLQELRRNDCLMAAMTGTGSTCFASYASAHARDESAKVLEPFFRDNHCKSLAAKTYIPT